jgi:hypothetical protein
MHAIASPSYLSTRRHAAGVCRHAPPAASRVRGQSLGAPDLAQRDRDDLPQYAAASTC